MVLVKGAHDSNSNLFLILAWCMFFLIPLAQNYQNYPTLPWYIQMMCFEATVNVANTHAL